MHAAQHPARRTRVIVLHEALTLGQPQLLVPFAAVGLTEEAAIVGERRRLDGRQPGQTGRKDTHRRKSVAACLYSPEMSALRPPGGPSTPITPTPGRRDRAGRESPPAPSHVWRAELTAVSDAVAEALSDDERRRAVRIASERARSRLVPLTRRAAERCSAATCNAMPPQRVAPPVGDGKPELAGDAGERPPLFFNLSHSRELALYAFGVDAPVGVDVQLPREERAGATVDHVALARRAFGEHEAQRLSLVEPARREREFLRAWTRYEAELKRRGAGIGGLRDALRQRAGGDRRRSRRCTVDHRARRGRPCRLRAGAGGARATSCGAGAGPRGSSR